MRGIDTDIHAWLDGNHVMPPMIYIDANCLQNFISWLSADSGRIHNVVSGVWHVTIFEYQLKRLFPKNDHKRLWSTVQSLNLSIDKKNVKPSDEDFLLELQRSYFFDPTSGRGQAEFLLLVRRCSRTSRPAVLSQQRAFRRVPDLNSYFLPTSLEGHDELPAQFDFFEDLRLHKKLKSVIDGQLAAGQYPDAVIESCKLLSEHLRVVTNLTSDGGALADDTLKIEFDPVVRTNSFTFKNAQRPKIKLNDWNDLSDVGEQRGYYRFAAGIADAFRNLNAHHSATDPIIINRFSEKRKALKIIGFISLLLEKIDERLSP